MRLACALVLLLIGLTIPLLLNGQSFTNNLVGIAFTSAAIALAHGPAQDALTPKASRLVGRVVVVVSVLFVVLLVAQLRTAYRFQAQFNRKVRALRELKQKGDRNFGPPGTFAPRLRPDLSLEKPLVPLS